MNYNILPLSKGNGRTLWVEITTDIVEGEGWTNAADQDIVEAMQAWCEESRCGIRMSYDQFAFKNEKELSMFMLRWSR
jgi:hypothetical protein